jgi:hypothetical protein
MMIESSNRLIAGTAGVIGSVMAAMKAHPSCPEVQSRACCALWRLMADSDNAAKMGAAGAIEAAAAAMKAHAGSEEVQVLACKALGKMTLLDHANKVKAGSAGVIEAAVAAIESSRPDDLELLRDGCTLLICGP